MTGPPSGLLCAQRHCSAYETACLADEICRENFGCAGGCATGDDHCTFICSESYQSPNVDNLMNCLFIEYECLQLPDPSPLNNITCKDPMDLVVSGIKTEFAQGDWYMTYGYSDLYDCFDCQILSYGFPHDKPIEYGALYDLVAANGTSIWNKVYMEGEELEPGVITYIGENGGLTNTQRFYFLINELETQMVYYCGDLLTWHFEGLLIQSKYP